MSDEKLEERADVRLDDPDNPEWTADDFARAKLASEAHGANARALVRKRGRPRKAAGERKEQVTLRIAPDVRQMMRSAGSGWMSRAEAALRREFKKRA